jgi:hypothetical protein
MLLSLLFALQSPTECFLFRPSLDDDFVHSGRFRGFARDLEGRLRLFFPSEASSESEKMAMGSGEKSCATAGSHQLRLPTSVGNMWPPYDVWRVKTEHRRGVTYKLA